MKNSHPYEEPAYDVWKLEDIWLTVLEKRKGRRDTEAAKELLVFPRPSLLVPCHFNQ